MEVGYEYEASAYLHVSTQNVQSYIVVFSCHTSHVYMRWDTDASIYTLGSMVAISLHTPPHSC